MSHSCNCEFQIRTDNTIKYILKHLAEHGDILKRQGHGCQDCEINENNLEDAIQKADQPKKDLEEFRERQGHGCQDCEINKKKLEEANWKAEQSKKDLDDFKQRMKVKISNEIGVRGDLSENINDPCRETELLKMYEILKNQTWKQIKERIPSERKRLFELGAQIVTETFNTSEEDMLARIMKIKEAIMILPTSEESKENKLVSQKLSDDMVTAIKNLQKRFSSCSMDLYRELATEILKTTLLQLHVQLHQRSFDLFRDFTAECYKVSCLMALHIPQLRPSWKFYTNGESNNHDNILFPAILNGEAVIVNAELHPM